MKWGPTPFSSTAVGHRCPGNFCFGGGEAPGPASESLPRRKPRGGRALEGATYGDLRVGDGAPGSVLKRRGEDCVDRKDDGELVRSCRCSRRGRATRPWSGGLRSLRQVDAQPFQR